MTENKAEVEAAAKEVTEGIEGIRKSIKLITDGLSKTQCDFMRPFTRSTLAAAIECLILESQLKALADMAVAAAGPGTEQYAQALAAKVDTARGVFTLNCTWTNEAVASHKERCNHAAEKKKS